MSQNIGKRMSYVSISRTADLNRYHAETVGQSLAEDSDEETSREQKCHDVVAIGATSRRYPAPRGELP